MKNEISLTWNDYKILTSLNTMKAINEMKSTSIYLLSEKTELSVSKVRNAIKKFIALGYIHEGVRQHHMKTYYITTEGIEKLKIIMGVDGK